MKLLRSQTLDPYFNLATEEYLFKQLKDDFLFLYRNHPSIIVGKHQNTLAEINLPFVLKRNIPVIRRLSGGGTVYHDDGNVNFCFIRNGSEGHLVNFREFTLPILEFLQSKGLDAYLGEKNELRIDKYKFSGNAEHLVKNRIMHHGTLLYNSNLQNLEEAIRIDSEKYLDKAVKSNRMTVGNLLDFLSKELSVEEFMTELTDYLMIYFPGIESHFLTKDDEQIIFNLIQSKYKTKEWNFGYSPVYRFKKSSIINHIQIDIELHTHQSRIKELNLTIQSYEKEVEELKKVLSDCEHHPEELMQCFLQLPDLSLWNKIDPESLCALFF